MKKFFLALIALLVLTACTGQKSQSQPTSTYISPPAAESSERQKILTESDFNGHGLIVKDAKKAEDTFRIQINPKLPIYTFHVVSFSPNGTPDEAPHIEVYKGENTSSPLQKFKLDPNGFLADSLPFTFNAADINFDGFTDIGVVVDGGAKWGAYQYWVYDQKSGKFITSPVTEDMRNIPANGITFDKEKKRIIASGLMGTGATLKVYQYENGRLNIVKDYLQENILVQDGKENTENPTLECHLTFKDYSGKIAKTRTEVEHHECSPKDFGFL